MTISAQSILTRVTGTLQDTTSIRWPVDELIRYLNDAQREVVLYRPDAMVKNNTLTCAAGSKQSIAALNGSKLIDVVRNNVSGKAIRLANREILDSQIPGWHTLTGQVDAVHYMYDPRDPTTFSVYPPVTTSAKIDLVYASYPTDISSVGDGGTVGMVSGNLSVPDIYSNVVQDYILYRAYSKDSEYAGNAQRAQAHYAAFANALGIEMKATVGVQPVSMGNPNTARQVQAQV